MNSSEWESEKRARKGGGSESEKAGRRGAEEIGREREREINGGAVWALCSQRGKGSYLIVFISMSET